MTNGERLPRRVRKALRVVIGYCNKNLSCDGCRLNEFCQDERRYPPANWEEWVDREYVQCFRYKFNEKYEGDNPGIEFHRRNNG